MTLRHVSLQLSYGPTEDRLHDFYIPALSASVRYDRMTGYFSSHALAIAAAGIAHLIANGGEMRLLVGAQLSPQDVAAIREGHDLRGVVAAQLESVLPDPASLTDQLLRDRLAALAWMVSTGALTIRVVLPKGPDGLPRPAPESREYFHPKVAVFTDAQGNQVAFSGSINESENAWRYHYEQFMVFTSWKPSRIYVAEAVGRFERLWEHREPDWISMPVPEAARQRLLRYTPPTAPTRDPLERERLRIVESTARIVLQPELERERVVARFLLDAPRLVGAVGLGAATCNVLPWPHQQAVFRDVQQSYPSRYLLADEVGLGKTIEAGLVLRQLWLSGIVRRALILAPKSVLRQWQEELYEKFALNVPIYDGAIFYDIDRQDLVPETGNPWDSVEMALASSQLVKRQDRQETLIAARPWDLVLVDEAHHARRKDFLDLRRYRPNRLLELLNKLQLRTRGLILMTATPMQVHPIEVWDLLNLLGLSGDWGVDGRHYLRFYEELLEPLDRTDWSTVFRMVRQERDLRGGELDPRVVEIGHQQLGPVDWERVRKLVDDPRPASTMKKLSPTAQSVAVTLAKEHTPLKRLVFRNTRDLLREYVRRGMLAESVPDRDPKPEWIKMQPEERALYDRIEEYITQFYRKYEDERKGLGFVMTVYRRRLTSSFYAVQRSLERRLAFLKGETDTGLEDEDVEQEALSQDVDELLDRSPVLFKEEIEYVEDFLHELSMLGGHDSKVQQLQNDLGEIFLTRDTVLVFTMYTDTMDFLRERLQPSYGRHVACYSGRGGERWDGVTWVPVTKEEIKNDFRTGKIKILLCTEAASEGLNLQTCGVLINYDMPWNPMRVEQRIGRIDRIGQRHGTVWVRNYFYEGTVEARVYMALSVRIGWFQHVVGRLQPILAQVGRAIQLLAMTPQAERDKKLREELNRIEKELDSQRGGIDLDEWADQAEGDAALSTPVSLEELEAFILRAPTLRGLFRPHEMIEGAYWLQGSDPEVVTFDADVFDAHPSTVQLLTYGNPLLDELLGRVAAETEEQMVLGHVLRVAVDAPLPRVGYYVLDGKTPRAIDRLPDLETMLEDNTDRLEWALNLIAAARSDLEQQVAEEWRSIEQEQEKIREAQRTVWEARAARLSMDAALVELTLGQTPDLFGEEQYPQAFNEIAVTGLARHGYPWTALLTIAGQRVQSPRPTDQFYLDIQGEAPERLKKRFKELKQQASELVNDYSAGGRE
jgi:superfamily II DNA or RNA helicase